MADEQAPAAPASAPAARKEPAPAARAKHWQDRLGVSDGEHEATMIAGKFRVNVDITLAKYQSALNRWRKGPA